MYRAVSLKCDLISGAVRSGGGVKVTMESVKGGSPQELTCDVLLVCIGRRPYTAKLGLEVRGGCGGDTVVSHAMT